MAKKLNKQKKAKKTVNHFADLNADLRVMVFYIIFIFVPFTLGILLAYFSK